MLHHAQFALSPLSLAVFTLLFAASSSVRLAHAQAVAAPEAAASSPAPAADAASPPSGVTLAPVTAKAAAPVDASTEGSGSYVAPLTTIGKGTLKLREVPHSMTVITREQLNDQNITTIEGALKNVTGVTVQRFDATGSYTQFIARGYAADSYQLDGLNLQTDTNGVYFDLAAYDRVEVQRGAASLFSGAGEPGVTVNMARKRAHDTPQTSFGVQYGSWDDRRIDLDTTGALNEAGTLRGRVVGVYQDFDTFMDGIDNNRKRMLYGTLELDITSRTTLSVGATYQHIDTVLSRGLPTYADSRLLNVPRETMPIQSWNFQTLQNETVFAELEHRGLDESLIKLALRYLRRTNDANYLDPAVARADGTMGNSTGANSSANRLSAAAFDREDVDHTVDLYYSKPFQAWGLKHNVLVGADYRDTRSDTRYSNPIWLNDTLDLNYYTPDKIAMPAFDLSQINSTTETHAQGVYGQVRIKPVEDWTLVGGGRYGSWSSSGVSYTTPQNYDAEKFIPYAAVINDLTKTLSAYASYNQIFKPQNNTSTTPGNAPLPPRVGRQYELGLKGDAQDGRLIWSVAVYDLQDVNRAVSDGAVTVAAGKAKSRGAEFDLTGEITPSWQLAGGYAYGKNEYVDNGVNTGLVGTPLIPFAPRHSYHLWTRHKFDLGPVTGMAAGFGLRGNSEFSNGTGAAQVRAGGYTLYGLNLSAPVSKELRVSLNVDNLFDKVYWEKVSGATRQNFFGEPRRITVALQGSY
jgi:TonB-dependent siderophore receptor